MMWQKKIKNNKIQYVSIGLMIIVSVSVFVLSFCFVAEFSAFSANVLTEENSSDVYLIARGTHEFLEHIVDEDVKENIESYESFKGSSISQSIVHNNKDVTLLDQMMIGVHDISEMKEFDIVATTNDMMAPQNGEVWLPQNLAQPNGITIGDDVTIKYASPVKLKVSGIYTAKLIVSPTGGFGPILVNEQQLGDLRQVHTEIDTALFFVNLKENTAEKTNKLNDNYPYTSLYLTREVLHTSFMSAAGVLGSIGTMAAILIFFFTMLMMRYVINIMIKRELNAIALYKSMGYRNKTIRKIYARGFMFVGSIATLIGTCIPIMFIEQLGAAAPYTTGFKVTSVTYVMAIMSVFVFCLILYVTIQLSLFKMHRLSVVGVRYIAQSQGKRKMAQPVLKSVKTPFAVAINDIWRHKFVNGLLVIVFMFSTFMSLFFLMVGHSASTMTANGNLWFGIPQNNTYAMGQVNEDVVAALNRNEAVISYVYGNVHYAVPLEADYVNSGLNNISLDVLSDRQPTITGIRIEGETPIKDNEVAMTQKALDVFDAKVGDTIKVKINKQARDLQVTGTYNTLMSDHGIMMSVAAIQEIVPEYTPTIAFITLKNSGDFLAFSTEFEAIFPDLTVEEQLNGVETAMSTMKAMLSGASLIIICAIVLLIMMSISLILLIEGTERRKEYGIMKALGFTNRFITTKVMLKNITVAFIGISLGLVSHLLFSQGILAQQVIDAFTDDLVLVCGVLILLLVLTVSITALIGLSTKSISTVELMEE